MDVLGGCVMVAADVGEGDAIWSPRKIAYGGGVKRW